MEVVDLPGVGVQVVAQDVDGAIVRAQAEVAVVFPLPAVEDLVDPSHVPRPAEANRDLAALRARGHEPTGVDGSAAFVRMARDHSGAPVWHQDFLALDLPEEAFDGVLANASLFHVPTRELPRVLGELHNTIRPGGVLFASNPRGLNEEGWRAGRYCAYHDLSAWTAFAEGAGFTAIDHYYRPAGLPRDQQPWLATLFRR